MEFLEIALEYALGLGQKYGVNPIVFVSIYFGAIPFFFLSIGWLIENYRKGKSILIPSIMAGFYYLSTYIYLVVEGDNIPYWVYVIMVIFVVYGVISVGWSVRRKLKNVRK